MARLENKLEISLAMLAVSVVEEQVIQLAASDL